MKTQQMFRKLSQIAKSKQIPIIDGHALVNNGRISATNLDTFLSYEIDLKGRAVIPVKDLSKMKFDSLEIDGDNLIITNKRLVSKIKLTFSPDDFPVEQTCTKKHGRISGKTLNSVKIAANFVSKDDLRPVMQAVCIDNNFVFGTDAHRLYYSRKPKSEVSGLLLPTEIVPLISEENYQVFVSKEGFRACFVGKNETISFRLVEGVYPNALAVIPEKGETVATVDRLQLKETIEMAMCSANKQIWRGEFTFHNNALEVYACDLDMGTEFKQEIPMQWDMADFMQFQIGLNMKFLHQILTIIKEPVISMQMQTNNRACVINKSFLLMPVMIEGGISADGWVDLSKVNPEPVADAETVVSNEEQPEPVADAETVVSNEEQPEPVADADTVTSNEEQPEPVADVEPVVSNEEQPEPVAPFIVDYTDKAIAVFGDTKPFRKQLKEIKGRWNPNLTLNHEKTPGWVFSKRRTDAVKQILGL